MGADFLMMYAAYPKGTDFDKEEQKMLERLETLNMNSGDAHWFIETEYDHSIDLEEDDEVSKNDNVRRFIRDIITGFFTMVRQCPRDLGKFEHKGDIIYCSGGMSWGDDPTEAYTLMSRFNQVEYLLREDDDDA